MDLDRLPGSRWRFRAGSKVGLRFFAVFMLLVSTTNAWGQFRPPVNQPAAADGEEGDFHRVLMLAPREFQQRLKQAEEALAENQFGEAIDHLGAILHGAPTDAAAPASTDDYFVGRPSDSHYRGSLRSEALRLLGSLPPEGKELYELQYGAEASRQLDQALQSRRIAALAAVSRQYFHTQAGYRATLLLGQAYLNLNRPLAAALCFERLNESPTAQRAFDPELSLLLATSWHLAEMNDQANDVLVSLKERSPGATFTIAGENVPIFSSTEKPVAWLARTMTSNPAALSSIAEQWRLHRGDPARNAQTDGSLPLQRARWRVQVANDPGDEELVQSISAARTEENSPNLPAAQPLVIGRFVLFRTTDNLLAVDFASGKRVWEFPWTRTLPSDTEGEVVGLRNTDLRREQIEERMWMDSTYGQMSSDGQILFVVDELGYTQQTAYGARINIIGGIPVDNPDQPKDYNSLVALDVATEGKFRWRVGGVSGEDEPALAGVFFLGAPLVLGQELYVLGERNSDISLFVLDVASGQLRWTQQLAHVGQMTILTDATRRLAGATPSFSNGILVCPMSGGALVAIDVANRSLLWGYQYPREMVNYSQGAIRINGIYAANQNLGRDRWVDSTVTIADRHVISTPVEGDELHCFDLLTGIPKWPAKPRGDGLYVAAVCQQQIIVVGRQRVTSYGLQDGEQKWNFDLARVDDPAGRTAAVSGRGFLSGQEYFLPTTLGLARIELTEGKLRELRSTEDALGNLVCFDNHLVSLSPENLSAYYRADRLEALVADRIATNPEDAWAIEHQAMLWLEQGQRDRALRALREALELYPQDDDRREATRSLLVETLLQALQDDFAANGQLAEEINELIDRPTQREAYLRLMAQGLLSQGRAKSAFDAFLELAVQQIQPGPWNGLEASGMPLLDSSSAVHQVRRDRFVRTGIHRAYQAASPDEQVAIQQRITTELQRITQQGNLNATRDILNLFSDFPQSEPLRIELAQRHLEQEEWLAAESVLAPLLMNDSPLAGSAWALLAQSMQGGRRPDLAAECYRMLRDGWANDPCLQHKTGQQLIDELPSDSVVRQRLAGTSRWQYGQVHVKPIRVTPTNLPGRFQLYTNFRPIRLRESVGPLATRQQVVFDAAGSNAIVVNDGLGQERVRITGTRGRINRFIDESLTCKSLGHLVFVNVGHGIVAVDTLAPAGGQEGRILWPEDYADVLGMNSTRRNVNVNISQRSNPWGQRVVTVEGRRIHAIGPLSYDGVVYLTGNRLVCVDPLTGETIWLRHDLASGSDVWGDEDYVFVCPRGETKARVFGLLDGSDLGERDVPKDDLRWTNVGRHLLTWSQERSETQSSTRLRLFDPWSSQDVWSVDVTRNAKGFVTDTGEVCVLQADGLLRLLDISSGREFIRHQVDDLAQNLRAVYVLPSDEQYVIVCGHEPQNVPGVTVTSFPDPQTAPLLDAAVYVFDRQTGQSMWDAPAIVEGFSLPLHQPTDVPVLAFVRQIFRNQGNERGRPQLSLLCLDKRDGRILLEADNLAYSYGSFSMTGNEEQQNVSLQLLHTNNYLLEFTDEPQPPAPPAQTGSAASHDGSGGIKSVVGAVFGALGRQMDKQRQRGEEEVKKLFESQVPLPAK